MFQGGAPQGDSNLFWRMAGFVTSFDERSIARKKEAEVNQNCDFSHDQSPKKRNPWARRLR
jgi:hypothetical protein